MRQIIGCLGVRKMGISVSGCAGTIFALRCHHWGALWAHLMGGLGVLLYPLKSTLQIFLKIEIDFFFS